MPQKRAGGEPGQSDAVVQSMVQYSEHALRIGDMAKAFNVTLRTLRFYEDKGLIAPRREGSTRFYSRRDQARMKLILLGRRVGFSLRDVKQIIDLYEPAGSNARQLRLTLDKSERQMSKLHQQQAATANAISELNSLIGDIRTMLSDRARPPSAAAK